MYNMIWQEQDGLHNLWCPVKNEIIKNLKMETVEH